MLLTQFIERNHCFSANGLLLLCQNPGPAGLGPSVLGVADHGRGAVGVGAEQGRDGVVAMSRVVGCENHLGGRRDSCFKQSPEAGATVKAFPGSSVLN